MIAQGLVAEVEKLLKMGYDLSLSAMSGIGYWQIGSFLKEELTLAEAVQQIKFETHRFVRHQYSWFRLKDDRIHWFDVTGCEDSDIEAAVAGFLAGETAGEIPLS
jgi:tRNA dimethylallyltransferase